MSTVAASRIQKVSSQGLIDNTSVKMTDWLTCTEYGISHIHQGTIVDKGQRAQTETKGQRVRSLV